jgi:GDP-L-fucose synthase
MNLSQAMYEQHTEPMLSHINVGYGSDITVKELAMLVSQTVGFQGAIEFDSSKPDGSPRKWMDSDRLNALGWQAQVSLENGLAIAYEDFKKRN